MVVTGARLVGTAECKKMQTSHLPFPLLTTQPATLPHNIKKITQNIERFAPALYLALGPSLVLTPSKPGPSKSTPFTAPDRLSTAKCTWRRGSPCGGNFPAGDASEGGWKKKKPSQLSRFCKWWRHNSRTIWILMRLCSA